MKPAAATAATTQPAQSSASGDRTTGLPRIAAMLKQLPLTRDHNPTELKTWLEGFEAYYEALSMQLYPRKSQLAYLWNCVEAAQVVTANMPVLGKNNSCLAVIRRYFR